MPNYGYNESKHCRWCGIQYYAKKPHNRDGFHSKACKQAHHRAYQKYVTTKRAAADIPAGKRVTRKKRKK